MREFLTSQCGLSTDTPIQGSFITHHHEAFAIWRDLIAAGNLTTPFEVVHIDSHADLGCGDAGYQYLMGEILNLDPSDRQNPEIALDKMNAGNFLAFAMACRWIDVVTYVPNPRSKSDLFEYYFKDVDSRTEIVELKAVEPERFNDTMRIFKEIPTMVSLEPQIKFSTVLHTEFRDSGAFDYITFCHSPSFTPVESDVLVPAIREFMLETDG